MTRHDVHGPIAINRELVTLRAGDAQLDADPLNGGSLLSWRISDVHVLRKSIGPQADPMQSACFPLIPYSNAIVGGGIHFDGGFYPVARNHPLEPYPSHGDAWLAAWDVVDLSHDRVLMSYVHSGVTGFPFSYRALQELLLEPRRLTIELRLTNTDCRPMPAGLGLHPYFCRLSGMRLHARHSGRWEAKTAIPDRSFRLPQNIGEETIDACYTGWRGVARLHWPNDDVVVTVRSRRPASALVIFSPGGADFVCIEPVTHVNDAINAAAAGVHETGVRVLLPSQSIALRVEMSLQLKMSL